MKGKIFMSFDRIRPLVTESVSLGANANEGEVCTHRREPSILDCNSKGTNRITTFSRIPLVY